MILGLFLFGITGATLNGNTLYTWGDRLLAWTLPKLKSQMLAAPAHPAASGCLDDQGTGLFLQEGDQLVYRKGPAWKARAIDHGIDMHDCLAATLLGHRGVLVVQLWMEELIGTFHYPRALAGKLIGEDNGPHSRLFLNGKVAAETNGIHSAFRYRRGYVLVGRDGVYVRK